MHKLIDQTTQEQIEALIDYHGLDALLTTISEICALKSEHIAVQWQDVQTAKVWMLASAVCDKAAATEIVGYVS